MRWFDWVAALMLAVSGTCASGQLAAAPINDRYADAIIVPPTLQTVIGDTTDAGPAEPGDPLPFDVDGSVWFRFKAGATAGKVLISVSATGFYFPPSGSPIQRLFDPSIGVYQATSKTTRIRRLVSDDSANLDYVGLRSVLLESAPNAVYFVRVSSKTGRSGAFRLNLVRLPQNGAGVLLRFQAATDGFRYKSLGPNVWEAPAGFGGGMQPRFNWLNATGKLALAEIRGDAAPELIRLDIISGVPAANNIPATDIFVSLDQLHTNDGAGYHRFVLIATTYDRRPDGVPSGVHNVERIPILIYRYAPDRAVKLRVQLPRVGMHYGALGKPTLVRVNVINRGSVKAKQCSLILDDLPVAGDWRTRSDLGVLAIEPIDIPAGGRQRFEYLLSPAMVGVLPEGRAIVRCVNTDRVTSPETFQITATRS